MFTRGYQLQEWRLINGGILSIGFKFQYIPILFYGRLNSIIRMRFLESAKMTLSKYSNRIAMASVNNENL